MGSNFFLKSVVILQILLKNQNNVYKFPNLQHRKKTLNEVKCIFIFNLCYNSARLSVITFQKKSFLIKKLSIIARPWYIIFQGIKFIVRLNIENYNFQKITSRLYHPYIRPHFFCCSCSGPLDQGHRITSMLNWVITFGKT